MADTRQLFIIPSLLFVIMRRVPTINMIGAMPVSIKVMMSEIPKRRNGIGGKNFGGDTIHRRGSLDSSGWEELEFFLNGVPDAGF